MGVYRCNHCKFISEHIIHRSMPPTKCANCGQDVTVYETAPFIQHIIDRWASTVRELNALKNQDKEPAEQQQAQEHNQSNPLDNVKLSDTNILANIEQHQPLTDWFKNKQITPEFDCATSKFGQICFTAKRVMWAIWQRMKRCAFARGHRGAARPSGSVCYLSTGNTNAYTSPSNIDSGSVRMRMAVSQYFEGNSQPYRAVNGSLNIQFLNQAAAFPDPLYQGYTASRVSVSDNLTLRCFLPLYCSYHDLSSLNELDNLQDGCVKLNLSNGGDKRYCFALDVTEWEV